MASGIDKTTGINERIRVREARLIDADGSTVGIVPIQALRRAEESALGRVEIEPQAKPPVCPVMDFRNPCTSIGSNATQESRTRRRGMLFVKQIGIWSRTLSSSKLFALHF